MFKSKQKPNAFDAFVHLVTYFALIMSAVALGGILFQFINKYFPDLENFQWYTPPSHREKISLGALRFHIANLLVTGPLFLSMTLYLHKLFRKKMLNPESSVRKWLTYVLLFAATVGIIGSVLSVFYQFLEGNYTPNFALKAGTILLIAGGIFGFYFWDLKRENFASKNKIAVGISVLIAMLYLSVFIGGFALIGSPIKARMQQFDRERIDAAMRVRWDVENEFRVKNKLPASLAQVSETLGLDPETLLPFQYEIIESNEYKLCINFTLESSESIGTEPNWILPRPVTGALSSQNPEEIWYKHSAGLNCHTFEITQPEGEKGDYVITGVKE